MKVTAECEELRRRETEVPSRRWIPWVFLEALASDRQMVNTIGLGIIDNVNASLIQ